MKPTTQVSGGDRIAQRIGSIRKRLASSAGVRVGVPAAAGTYEDGQKIAVIAAVNEFGSADGRIPERSFLRVPLRANQGMYAKIFERQLPSVLDGSLTVFQILSQVGARAAGDSQEAIESGIAPPNAPSTIAQKGSSNPLVNDGDLKRSITYIVDGETEG